MVEIIVGVFLIYIVYRIIKTFKFSRSVKQSSDDEIIDIFRQNNITNFFIGKDLVSAIGLNEKDETILLLNRKDFNAKYTSLTLPFSEIFEVKLNEDDVTVTSTQRGSQLLGTAVGASLLGIGGAVIGGLSAKQRNEKEVKEIFLEIVVDNLTNPIHKICFMNEFFYLNKNELRYKEQHNIAEKWYKTLSVIIKRNELNS